jgi:uncharacterized protein (TIGR02646 family)
VISIQKGDAPHELVRLGKAYAQDLCPGMKARSWIYASEDVKAQLETSHRGKCCYCEMNFDEHRPYAFAYVDHWRPKSSFRQARGEKRVWPGYYWLAYDWDNLLLSCAFCNSTKSDLFPLEDQSTRALDHRMSLDEETPSILKPDRDRDLHLHITFVNEVPKGLTPRGCKTIKTLGLASDAHEPRLTYLNMIRKARRKCIELMCKIDPDQVDRLELEYLRKTVRDAVEPDKPYSAMVTAFLAAYPLPEPAADTATVDVRTMHG